jgi:glutathione transport system ATP-binding protein
LNSAPGHGPPGPDEILSVSDLALSFPVFGGFNAVLHGVSFAVRRGETLAIVGESGSGKTVTLRRVMGLLHRVRTDAGTIRLRKRDGRVVDITHLTPSTAREIRGVDLSMVFQEPMTSLNPLFTVGNQLEEAILAHESLPRAEATRKALELLEVARIPDAARRIRDYPHQLSGGMRQRVMIAMALACRPQILIADEPTTALDVTIQAQILGLIRSVQREYGMAVVFITHDMGVVAEMAERVIVMYRGRIVETNEVKSLFDAPRHPYTAALLRAVPRLGAMQGRRNPATLPLMDMERELEAPPGGAPPPPEEEIDTADYRSRPILEVRGLTTRFVSKKSFFGRPTHLVHAVEGVSFELYPGETLGIVGESGCGKTTTGYAALRLVPAEGEVLLDGRSITAASEDEMQRLRQNIQFVFQDPFASLNPRRTVGDSIAEPLVVHAIGDRAAREAKVAELLERVGIPAGHAGRYPHEFSGGQRQRIAIARALATHPRVIVADEAVSSLDVSIRATVLNLMMGLQRDLKLAFIFISHDMAVIERVSHRVAVMYLGQIVEIGSRAEVFENPRHPYTRKLLAAVPVADPARRTEFSLMTGEIPSPVRRVGNPPARVRYEEVAPGHSVAVQGEF